MSDRCPACAAREHDRPGLIAMLQSGTAWLGMLGALAEAVRSEDWPRARELAAQHITFPQPYPDN